MKNLNLFLLTSGVFALAGAGFATPAKADYHPEHGYRYKTVYRDWDSGFYDYYSYREVETCRVSYGPGFSSRTCYDQLEPTDYVWVEEQHESGGYTRVTVYDHEGYDSPFVEYHVFDDGVSRRVEHRHFYRHRYYHDDWDSVEYRQDSVVFVQIDWNTAWGKVFTGLVVADLGADVLSDSRGSDAGTYVGLGLLASGIGSSISAAIQARQESELEKACVAAKTAGGTDVL